MMIAAAASKTALGFLLAASVTLADGSHYVFETGGDSYYDAFESASECLKVRNREKTGLEKMIKEAKPGDKFYKAHTLIVDCVLEEFTLDD